MILKIEKFHFFCVTQQSGDEIMPDFANMTEEEQIAFAMQMSMQEAREFD